jgi:hypothetical protein
MVARQTRDQIVYEVHIGPGTVSSIVRNCRTNGLQSMGGELHHMLYHHQRKDH